MKQQVEYLREDGKNKQHSNEMLTIVETDGNIKITSIDKRSKFERKVKVHSIIMKTYIIKYVQFYFGSTINFPPILNR